MTKKSTKRKTTKRTTKRGRRESDVSDELDRLKKAREEKAKQVFEKALVEIDAMGYRVVPGMYIDADGVTERRFTIREKETRR